MALREIPQTQPLQPAPQNIKPDYSGNINSTGGSSATAAQPTDSQDQFGAPPTPKEGQTKQVIQQVITATPKSKTGGAIYVLLGVLILAGILYWFFRRAHGNGLRDMPSDALRSNDTPR